VCVYTFVSVCAHTSAMKVWMENRPEVRFDMSFRDGYNCVWLIQVNTDRVSPSGSSEFDSCTVQ